jgi:MYXO-CTERM domain-containing protein
MLELSPEAEERPMTMLRTTLGGAVVLALMAASSQALADCYVDSQGGNDSLSGQSEDEAVQSQDAIPSSGCGVVRYKRGSVFNEAVRLISGVTTYTNYGDSGDLPKFVVPHTTNSGPLVSAYQGGITIDGLYLEGSKGDGSMGGLGQGVCVTIGGNSQVLNCEITNCDVGMMLHGEGSLIQGNYFHDMTMAVDAPQGSTDPNLVGGGNGIFIHGSNNEIAYNSFVRCADYAEWTESPCDGGATEITVGSGATVTGVSVHHNFSLESCGFLEIASMTGETGRFENSEFYYNVHIDGGWLMLLQVNNTEMSNVRFDNNTVVQHSGSYNTGMVVTVFDGFSSGTEGGTLDPGEVSMTNNLIIFDGVTSFGDVIDPAITQAANLIINTSDQDPGVVNVAGTAAEDFDLLESSPARDQGTVVSGHTLDFLNRTAPDPSGLTDIGAFEFGSEQGAEVPEIPQGTGGTGTGGTENTGGEQATSTGGEQASSTGGEQATGTGGTTGNEDPEPTCTAPLSLCGEVCVDLASDPNNCGVCGNVCATGELCSAGVCTGVCGDGLTQCGQSCVDLNTDILNCGSCGAACLAGQTCVAGVCTGSATGGQVTEPVLADTPTAAGDTTASSAETANQTSGCACSVVGAKTQGLLARLGLILAVIAAALRRRSRVGP